MKLLNLLIFSLFFVNCSPTKEQSEGHFHHTLKLQSEASIKFLDVSRIKIETPKNSSANLKVFHSEAGSKKLILSTDLSENRLVNIDQNFKDGFISAVLKVKNADGHISTHVETYNILEQKEINRAKKTILERRN